VAAHDSGSRARARLGSFVRRGYGRPFTISRRARCGHRPPERRTCALPEVSWRLGLLRSTARRHVAGRRNRGGWTTRLGALRLHAARGPSPVTIQPGALGGRRRSRGLGRSRTRPDHPHRFREMVDHTPSRGGTRRPGGAGIDGGNNRPAERHALVPPGCRKTASTVLSRGLRHS